MNDQIWGRKGSSGYGKPTCNYNCYCDNCCNKMRKQRENTPSWKSAFAQRQQEYNIARGKK